MKRFLLLVIAMFSQNAAAQVAMMYKDDIPGDTLVCVTNWGPYVSALQNSTNRWNASTITNAQLSVRLTGLEAQSNVWNRGAAAAAYAYSPTNPPPVQSVVSYATNAGYSAVSGVATTAQYAVSAGTVTGAQSNDIVNAVAHVADTNLHIAAGERLRIAAALTNADEFAPAAHVADAAAHFTAGEKASVTGNVESLMEWMSAFTMVHITVNGDTQSLLFSPSFTAATTNQGAKADSALQPASTNGWTVAPHQAWLTEEADTNALAQLAAYKPIRLWSENNRFAVLDGGTNVVVYEINEVAYTNYTITLSSDFEETVTHTRPAWTNNVFPVYDGNWAADNSSGTLFMTGPGSSSWYKEAVTNFPATLDAANDAQGSAVVYQNFSSTTNELFRIPLAAITNVVPETWTYADHTNWMAVAGTNWVVQSVLDPWWFYARADYVPAEEYDLAWINHTRSSGNPHSQYLKSNGGTATNLDLYSDWQTFSGVTGAITLTNLADRPIQCTGTGAVSLAFSGLKPPIPIYLTLGGFDSVSWPTNAYAVGGWGTWQTNRINHFSVWTVGTEIFVNSLTTSEE